MLLAELAAGLAASILRPPYWGRSAARTAKVKVKSEELAVASARRRAPVVALPDTPMTLTLAEVTLEKPASKAKKRASAAAMPRRMVSEKEVTSMVALVATGTRITSSPTTSGAVNGDGEGEGEGDTPEGRGEGLAVREARGVPVPVSVAVAEPEARAVPEDSEEVAEPEARAVPVDSVEVGKPEVLAEPVNREAVEEPEAHTVAEEDREAVVETEAHTVPEEVCVALTVLEAARVAEPDAQGELETVAVHVHMQEQKAVCEGLMERSAEGEPLSEAAELVLPLTVAEMVGQLEAEEEVVPLELKHNEALAVGED